MWKERKRREQKKEELGQYCLVRCPLVGQPSSHVARHHVCSVSQVVRKGWLIKCVCCGMRIGCAVLELPNAGLLFVRNSLGVKLKLCTDS
jgi:hypothetical protein